MWENLDEDTRAAVMAAPDASLEAAIGLADITWLPLFYSYLAANGADQTVLNAVLVADAINRAESVENLFAMVNTEGTHPFPIDMDSLYVRMAIPTSGEEHQNKTDLMLDAGTYTQAWWSAFVDEATRIRHWDAREGLIDEWQSHAGAVPEEGTEDRDQYDERAARTEGMPVHSTMSMDDLDGSYIDSVNDYELKQMDEGGNATFIQLGDVLLIGSNFPPAYTTAVENSGTRTQTPAQGRVTMVAKGSTFSSGKISIAYLSPGADPDNAKVALRRVTKKSIAFE